MGASIKDVAKKAGVSISTVSLVINKKNNVTEETRQRVLNAIKELHFHPRRTARGLASQRSGNIGFIIIHDHFTAAEPFYTRIFLGTEFETRCTDYYILLTTIERAFSAKNMPRFLVEKNVDGVILAGYVPPKILEFIRAQELPIVLIDYYPPQGKYSAILIDNVGGAKKATEHLIQAGHRRIAFIAGDLAHPSISGRLEGYQQALAEANIAFDATLVCCDGTNTGMQDGIDTTCALLERKAAFTALVCANDAMALGALYCLRDHHLTVPDDIALVGFDDVEAARNSRPALTTLHVPKEEMGALAVRRLIEMIDQKNHYQTITQVPVELIVRESCGSTLKSSKVLK